MILGEERSKPASSVTLGYALSSLGAVAAAGVQAATMAGGMRAGASKHYLDELDGSRLRRGLADRAERHHLTIELDARAAEVVWLALGEDT